MPNKDGSVPVRLYFKPHVLMIWLGAVFMFIGGGLSLSDRRLRIGAPRPAKAQGGAAGGGVNAVKWLHALVLAMASCFVGLGVGRCSPTRC